jgi:hypothetical protein
MSDKLILRSRDDDDDIQPLEKYNDAKTMRKLDPLESLLNPRTIKLINSKVFKGNESEFKQFIRDLESYRSWQESLKKIEDELSRRRVKQNDQGAVMLTNIVYRRYYPHDEGVKID